jgi:hypothetical protein
MKALLMAGVVMASASSFDSVKVWRGDFPGDHGHVSYVELHEPTMEGAAATITFQNKTVHSGDETFTLSWSGIDVVIELEKDVDNWTPEQITVIESPGYAAEPRSIVVQEDSTGQIHLFPFFGA